MLLKTKKYSIYNYHDSYTEINRISLKKSNDEDIFQLAKGSGDSAQKIYLNYKNYVCRDDAGQITRDPRKTCLTTRRERLPRHLKQTQSHLRASIQLSTCRKAFYAPPVLCARIRPHQISRILCHNHHHTLHHQ